MTEAEIELAKKIVLEAALWTLQGEGDIRRDLLAKYGDYGFDLAEKYCKQELNGPSD